MHSNVADMLCKRNQTQNYTLYDFINEMYKQNKLTNGDSSGNNGYILKVFDWEGA